MIRKPNPSVGDACAVVLLTLLFSLFVFSFAIFIGWNLFVPSVLNGPSINFAQAFGAALLATIVRGLLSVSVNRK